MKITEHRWKSMKINGNQWTTMKIPPTTSHPTNQSTIQPTKLTIQVIRIIRIIRILLIILAHKSENTDDISDTRRSQGGTRRKNASRSRRSPAGVALAFALALAAGACTTLAQVEAQVPTNNLVIQQCRCVQQVPRQLQYYTQSVFITFEGPGKGTLGVYRSGSPPEPKQGSRMTPNPIPTDPKRLRKQIRKVRHIKFVHDFLKPQNPQTSKR